MVKRTSRKTLVASAKPAGRSAGRLAKRPVTVKAIGKTPLPGPRRKKVPETAPVTTAKQGLAKVRESWKAQQQHAEDAVKIQHGTTVDERAHARVTDGLRWAARQTR